MKTEIVKLGLRDFWDLSTKIPSNLIPIDGTSDMSLTLKNCDYYTFLAVPLMQNIGLQDVLKKYGIAQ